MITYLYSGYFVGFGIGFSVFLISYGIKKAFSFFGLVS